MRQAYTITSVAKWNGLDMRSYPQVVAVVGTKKAADVMCNALNAIGHRYCKMRKAGYEENAIQRDYCGEVNRLLYECGAADDMTPMWFSCLHGDEFEVRDPVGVASPFAIAAAASARSGT